MKKEENSPRPKYCGAAFPLCNNEHVTHEYPTEQPVYVAEQTQVDGRLLTKQVVKTIDRRQQEEGNKVTDFCLENQIAIGSVGLRSSVCYGADATDRILAGAEEAMRNMDAAAAAKS